MFFQVLRHGSFLVALKSSIFSSSLPLIFASKIWTVGFSQGSKIFFSPKIGVLSALYISVCPFDFFHETQYKQQKYVLFYPEDSHFH